MSREEIVARMIRVAYEYTATNFVDLLTKLKYKNEQE